jgi:hypothetical protein
MTYRILFFHAKIFSYTAHKGFLEVAVPVTDLPINANLIGSGAPGVKYYPLSTYDYFSESMRSSRTLAILNKTTCMLLVKFRC